MKKINTYILFILAIYANSLVAQGVINVGARIVMRNNASVFIKGASGNYTGNAGGMINNFNSGGKIYLAGNWVNNSGNTGFANDGTTVVLNGAGQNISGTSSTLFYNLNLDGSSTKTLMVNTQVGGQGGSGSLSLGSSALDLNSHTLTVNNPSTNAISNSGGYIISETNLAINPSILRWNTGSATGAYVFPFGVAGTQVPFTFSITTGMYLSTDYVSVSTRATATSDNQPWAGASDVPAVTDMFSTMINADASVDAVIDRWWDINPSSAVVANLVFSYRGVENTLTSPNNAGSIVAQHWNGSYWDVPVGTGNAVLTGVGTCTVNGASTFSPWTLTSVNKPLPVELSLFTYTCTATSTNLIWTTQSETNNDYFLLEGSANGTDYTPLAKIKGAGNSHTVNNYKYALGAYSSAMPYYRLKQTDYNGNYKYSPIIFVSACNNTTEAISGFYYQGHITVNLINQPETDVSIKLFDISCNEVFAGSVHCPQGNSSNLLDTGPLAKGLYLLQMLSATNLSFSKRIIVLPN